MASVRRNGNSQGLPRPQAVLVGSTISTLGSRLSTDFCDLSPYALENAFTLPSVCTFDSMNNKNINASYFIILYVTNSGPQFIEGKLRLGKG